MLDIAVAKRLGRFQLDVAARGAPGSTLVIVGESGSGKTTLLRLLAGLEQPDAGHISLEGERYCDRAAGIDTPPWERAVGFVPQDYALFPHLTVFENVAFGLGAQGISAAEAAPRVTRTLDQLGVAALAYSHPSQLSGGQQQRVALARALVLEPRLLLLDEPLSALDLRTRRGVRAELRRIFASLSCVTVYVTHAPAEALLFGDRIGVLEDGRLTQIGAREEFLTRPQSSYAASLFNLNLWRGAVIGQEAAGVVRVSTPLGEVRARGEFANGSEVVLTVQPRMITLHRERPADVSLNLMQGRVEELLLMPPSGERCQISIEGARPLVADVEVSVVTQLQLREGEMVWATFAIDGVVCYSQSAGSLPDEPPT